MQQLASLGATHIAIPCNTAHSPIIMNQVRRFIESADEASVEKMMELAIAEGNFDAIDLLDNYL